MRRLIKIDDNPRYKKCIRSFQYTAISNHGVSTKVYYVDKCACENNCMHRVSNNVYHKRENNTINYYKIIGGQHYRVDQYGKITYDEYIPLPFWFSKTEELAIPVIAIPYHSNI